MSVLSRPYFYMSKKGMSSFWLLGREFFSTVLWKGIDRASMNDSDVMVFILFECVTNTYVKY